MRRSGVARGLNFYTLFRVSQIWSEGAAFAMGTRLTASTLYGAVGQNPCGSVAQLERKKQIYAVCVKYDVILAEDDVSLLPGWPLFSLMTDVVETFLCLCCH